MRRARITTAWLWLAGLLLVLLIAFSFYSRAPKPARIAYTKLQALASQGKVASVLIRGYAVQGQFKTPQPVGLKDAQRRTFQTQIPEFANSDILHLLRSNGVTVYVAPERGGAWNWLGFVLPWVLIIGGSYWLSRRMSGQAASMKNGLDQLIGSKGKRAEPETSYTRFADIAGQDAMKRDVVELVEFLKRPERYRALGADVPHGVLLYGPPGTGKTLTARALAGEAGVPFFHMSASEFIEMIVGVGAARVRKTFAEAKNCQPSILFIDEIDAVGRRRGTGVGGGNDEREQTLNQILSEMDGFTERQTVIVIAATNRPDVLDPALLRPGRFDRRLALELPDRKDRVAILRSHTRKVPLSEDMSLDALAAGTPGFSGADLKNLVNEAAMLAARDSKRNVAMSQFLAARDKVLLGPSRPLTLQADEHHRLAVHESGHTAVAYFLPLADPPFKVTIIPRGRALGGTEQLPEAERYVTDEDYLRGRLAVLLGGRAAERVFLGNVSSGADDDIAQATKLARAMVTRWGMSPDIGPIDLSAGGDEPFVGLDITRRRPFSDRSTYEADEAIKDIVFSAANLAEQRIEEHKVQIEELIDALEREETLTVDQIRNCLDQDCACTTGEVV